jgi:hypothetical protein
VLSLRVEGIPIPGAIVFWLTEANIKELRSDSLLLSPTPQGGTLKVLNPLPSRASGTAVFRCFDIMPPMRAIVFVDGGNWYFKLKELLLLVNKKPRVDFDIRGLTQELVTSNELIEVRYYIGKLKRQRGNEKSEMLYAKQQQLIGHLQQQNVRIGYGHIISYPDGGHHEKGVDVLIAVDMIRLASEDEYDVAYLLSSDNSR